jgi:cation transport ATPase
VGKGAAGEPSSADRVAGESSAERAVRRRAHHARIEQFKRARRIRFLRSFALHLPLVIIGAMLLMALVLVLLDRWRRGAFTFGVATLLAAWFRLILPETQAGLLAVRTRRFDVAVLAAFGGMIVWLTLSIDPLGTG